jgi:hypothetical protein
MSLQPEAKFNQRHLQILDAYLAGKKGVDIARALNMTQAQVSLIINSPTFQHELALRRASIAEKQDVFIAQKSTQDDPVVEKLKKEALTAANRLALNLCDMNGNVANKAACEILDRAGYAPTKKLEVNEKSLQVVINASDASLIAESLRMLSQ